MSAAEAAAQQQTQLKAVQAQNKALAAVAAKKGKGGKSLGAQRGTRDFSAAATAAPHTGVIDEDDENMAAAE